ncbi:hypothetical protein SUGI_0046360 [Cryptomeria japonica]|nr:hypothetical protein SUGI_0046360 [Cryptomeria japonica]
MVPLALPNGSSPAVVALPNSASLAVVAQRSFAVVPQFVVGPPTVLGSDVGGLGAKIPVGDFVPPKPSVCDPVLDLDAL